MVLDLVVETDDGIINVELNNKCAGYVDKRNLIYFCRLVGNTLKTADNYEKVTSHIQINLTWGLQSFYKENISDKGKIIYSIRSEEGFVKHEEIFKIIDVNMDYYEKRCYNKSAKENKFLKFLASKNEEELLKNCKGDLLMEKIKDNVIKLNANPDIIDALYVDGEEERVKNTERIIGFADGKQKEKLEIAKNMLNEKIDVKTISKVTGLSKEEIEKLK